MAALTLSLSFARQAQAQQATGATFGQVIPLAGGTPSDVVLDESRHSLYLIDNNTSQVQVFDYTSNTVTNTISVGKTPLAGAMSMDNSYLYVTSSGTATLNVINLSTYQVVNTVVLPSQPQGVEVGNDGRVLISMVGTGVVSGVPQGTLSLFDPTLPQGQQLVSISVPALPSTPAPLPTTTLTRPVTTFPGKLLRTPDGQFIVGVITPTSSSTYIFVYEVDSAVVLSNRTVSGSSSVLAMAPDGSRFMAGMTLYDTASLTVLAQQNNANAPFPFTGAVNTLANIGGSVFSPDGTTIYSAFNTAASTTPPPPSQSSTLLINDSTNLGIHLGINLPESIVAKIVMTADGSQAWGLSNSGLTYLPLGNLYNYPILMPQTNTVFLAQDNCNLGVASGTLQINNLGQGKLTFTVATLSSSALVYRQSSGLAPATITFTMEPGRSGVLRQAGTNIWTGAGTSQGVAFNVTLSSPNAINIPNTIRVYMNYRQPDQSGVIYPVPTTPNSNSNNSDTNASGNEGLQDLMLDEPRSKLYITNSGYNRIEVFDLAKQQFTTPIPVGQMPHQMAMSTDGNTLYVGNIGGESISIVDLNLEQVVDRVVLPPVPRNGTAAVIYPKALAMGLFGLQFVMSNGSQWKVVNGDQATVRPSDSVTPTEFAGAPTYRMLGAPDYSYILTLDGSGNAYLYDGIADTYVGTRLLFSAPIEGFYGVLGAGPSAAYLLANGLILNSSLTPIGGSATPGSTTITLPTPGGGIGPPTTTVINTGQRNVASLAPLDANDYLRLSTSVRQTLTSTTPDDPRATLQIVNLATGSLTLAAVAPENPPVLVFGTTRTNIGAHQLVVNSAGTTAYAITLSGLSVVPLASSGAPVINSGATGIVNSADGTTNIEPGSFITINGQNLASSVVASTIPPPTVLGGSCVTFGDVSVPLLSTSSGQIQAQVPVNLPTGLQVVEVRSLATAQSSAPVVVTVSPAGPPPGDASSGSGTGSGSGSGTSSGGSGTGGATTPSQ